jgi:hypothetical protein
MAWFAAHAIMYFELTDGPQDGYQVYEIIFLVRAETPEEGYAKARELARRDEGDDRSSLRLGNRPARLVFGGIRKLVSVLHEHSDGQIGDGDEITYSELVVPDRKALQRLIADEDVDVEYIGNRSSPPE